MLDVDALAKADGVDWVFNGADCLPPEYRRCMVSLSRGGGRRRRARVRHRRRSSSSKDGFCAPRGEAQRSWRDENTLWVGTDFGPGSLTTSGYPRIVKLWTRGTPLAEASTVFEGRPEDVASGGGTEFTPEGRYDVVTRIAGVLPRRRRT